MTRRSKTTRRRTKNRFAPAIAVVFALILVALLSAFFAGAFSLLPVVQKEPERMVTEDQHTEFSLAPPSFLLRLSLFPEGQKKREIIGVMIENQEDARPYQLGLERALFIQEFPVEGMISRFLALFDRHDLPVSVGPTRSLRPYFVDASQPWTGAIMHAGGSPEAFERAKAFKDLATVNVLQFDDEKYTLRRSDVPAPHNLFLSEDILEELLPENIVSASWPPYPTGGPPVAASGATTIRINFLSTLHNVEYRSQQDGSYLRINGGTVSALKPHNVLILQIPVTEIGEFGRLTIPLEGKGPLLLFRSGYSIPGKWRYDGPKTGFTFLDVHGQPLRLAAGATWMTVVQELGRVKWEN